ncbi:RWP-RK domain - like 6 [Theobroma cacao]|nr:RWP-RK domain - like 6 [Theobroma cacao]
MADPNANDPDDDPHYVPLVDEALNFMNNMEPILPDDAMNIFMGNVNHPFMDDSRNNFLNAINPTLFGNSSSDNSDVLNLRVNSQSDPSMNNLRTCTQMQQNFENEDLNNLHVPTRVNSTVQEPSQHPFIPQSGEKRKQHIKVNHFEELINIFTHKKDNSNAGCSGSGPSKIHGKTSNQDETNLVNKSLNNPNIPIQQDLLPVQEPVLHPSSIPPFTEQEATNPLQIATNGEGMHSEPNLENAQASMRNELNLENSPTGMRKEPNLENSQVETGFGIQRLDRNKGKLSVGLSRPPPSGCSGCQMLREITHRKDDDTTVVLDAENIDFYDKGFRDVEKFLSQYFIKQEQEGWSMHDDPRAVFFKVLCFGPGGVQTAEAANTSNREKNPVPPTAGVLATAPAEAANTSNREKNPVPPTARVLATAPAEAANTSNREKNPVPQTARVLATAPAEASNHSNAEAANTSISQAGQRKRIKMLTFDDLKPFFEMLRKDAARRLNLSETVLHNIFDEATGKTGRRWPYREIAANRRKIAKLTAIADSTDNPAASDRARDEIRTLEEQIDALYRP